jgi:hypothetical protein
LRTQALAAVRVEEVAVAVRRLGWADGETRRGGLCAREQLQRHELQRKRPL